MDGIKDTDEKLLAYKAGEMMALPRARGLVTLVKMKFKCAEGLSELRKECSMARQESWKSPLIAVHSLSG